MKKFKKYLGAIIVASVVLALILPSSAVVTNNKILNKNLQNSSNFFTISAVHKTQPNPEPLNRGEDVLVSWDNPDEDDEKPKIAANADKVIVLTYEATIDVLTRVNPLTYSDDSGESWNLQFLIDSSEFDGSGTLESPDITYCPENDEFFWGSIDPLETDYHVTQSWIPGDIAGATEIPIWRFEWGQSEDYTECAITYVGMWSLILNICTYTDVQEQAPFLNYQWYSWEDEWAYNPNEVDPEWCAGIYYDGQSILETALALKPEITTGQNRMYMVMESYNETDGITRISYKATYTDLDPESETFLFTDGGGPSGMDKYADIEVWPFQMFIAENAFDPDVSAAGSTVAVVYSQGGNVICKASSDNGDTFTESTVATGAGYPCVYVAGSRVYVAYVQNEDLYITHSDNLGGSWDTPIQINDEDGSVAEESGTADLGEYGIVWTDTRDGQYDIFFEYMELSVSNPPGKPTISGPTDGDSGVPITFTFNAVDPDGDQVRYHINWGDGDSDTTTLAASGTDKTASHTWVGDEKTFTITAYAEDENGVSGPTETHNIYIPRPRARFYNLFDVFPNLFRFLNIIFG